MRNLDPLTKVLWGIIAQQAGSMRVRNQNIKNVTGIRRNRMKYFKPEEFVMGSRVVFDEMNPAILYELDKLRKIVDKPFIITSCYRDEEYNKLQGGAESSQHLLGNAVDISTKTLDGKAKAKLIKHALMRGLSVGIAKSFIHIDCRNTESVVWSY